MSRTNPFTLSLFVEKMDERRAIYPINAGTDAINGFLIRYTAKCKRLSMKWELLLTYPRRAGNTG